MWISSQQHVQWYSIKSEIVHGHLHSGTNFLTDSSEVSSVLTLALLTDTFRLYQLVGGQKKLVPFDGKGIAWWTDYNLKYRNPSLVDGSLAKAFNGNFLITVNL